ncbi:MAG: hypothetical protein LBU47_07160 [Christensenellaceae bacterium]|jgi:hypothetical protein|nr:hypothetical protein [Christensenellaceae bacterium]
MRKRAWLAQTLAFSASCALLWALNLAYTPFVEWIRAQPKEFRAVMYPFLITFDFEFLAGAAVGLFVPLFCLFGKKYGERLRFNWLWILFFALLLLLRLWACREAIALASDDACLIGDRERLIMHIAYDPVPTAGFFCTAFLLRPAGERKTARFYLPFAAFATVLLFSEAISPLIARLWPPSYAVSWVALRPTLFLIVSNLLLFPCLAPELRGTQTSKAISLIIGALGLLFVLENCGSLLLYCGLRLLNFKISSLPQALRALWALNQPFWKHITDRLPLIPSLFTLSCTQIGLLIQSGLSRKAAERP